MSPESSSTWSCRTLELQSNSSADPAGLVFFYGTLMAGLDRRRRAGLDEHLSYRGRGRIRAALFDLGPYPAALPAPDGFVWGELYEARDPARVLRTLDAIECFAPHDPDHSLYIRTSVEVLPTDGPPLRAWVYFYNAPLGRAPRIESGDYLEYVRRP